MAMSVQHFFDPATSTFSYVVSDSATSRCALSTPCSTSTTPQEPSLPTPQIV